MGTCKYDHRRKDLRKTNTFNDDRYYRDSSILNYSKSQRTNSITQTNNSITQKKNNNPQKKNNKTQRNNNNTQRNNNNPQKNINSSINNNSKVINKKNKDIKSSNIESEKVAFPKGENYYQLIVDSNRSELIKKNDNLCEKVELFFSLSHVQNPNDEYSFAISIINNTRIGISTYLGKLENRTGEEIEFGNSFIVDFFFEREQKIIIEPIINNDIIKDQKIEFSLCKLMTRIDNKLSIKINDVGILEINYKKKENQNNELNSETSVFQFNILLNNDIFNTEESLKGMFFVIRNVKDGIKRRPVYKSHEYDFKLNEKKKTSFISLDSKILCNNDDSPIFFELYSPNINKAKHIGYCSFNIKKLKSNLSNDKIELLEIKSENNGKLGILEIIYSCRKIINFEHYIKNGQINLDIAIDYTESNGLPSSKSSLHYIKAEGGNDYEKAIKSCGKIIANYDYDQLFPVYGFGGIPPNSNKVSHCFNINFDENPEIQTVENIIKKYKESLDKVTFSGPTNFAPVIKKVMSEINDDLENNKKENHYYILLILTDGVIIDMKDTVDCIVEASKLPLSIVIVGIGESDFENMEVLDGDDKPLVNSYGEIRKRDIVQFVKLNTFKEKNAIKEDNKELAEEVLKEIPRQIEEYYKFCGQFYEQSSDN